MAVNVVVTGTRDLSPTGPIAIEIDGTIDAGQGAGPQTCKAIIPIPVAVFQGIASILGLSPAEQLLIMKASLLMNNAQLWGTPTPLGISG
jgi:hypothetical protein